MVDLIHDYYAYWAIVLLLAVGMYGMIVKKNLMKKVVVNNGLESTAYSQTGISL